MLGATIATARSLKNFQSTVHPAGEPFSPVCVEGLVQQVQWRVRRPPLGKRLHCGCSSATPAQASFPQALEPGKKESPAKLLLKKKVKTSSSFAHLAGASRPILRVGVEDPMGVWGGGAGVRHRYGPSWGGRRRSLVLRARVWNCDGEGSKAGEGCRRGGGLVNFIPCELLVGIVHLLKQRLEPEPDVGAREPDGAAGNVNRF